MNYRRLLISLIFWPIAFISVFMNVWLFASFFLGSAIYSFFGGVVGAAVDLFKLYSLYSFDMEYRLHKIESRGVRSFPAKHLIYFLFFMFVSAGSSLLFGLIEIDKSIEIQGRGDSGASRDTLVREIHTLKNSIEDLLNFDDLNTMSERIAMDTNRLLLSSGVLKIKEEKEKARKEAEKLSLELAGKEKDLANIRRSSSGTFEAFDYLAKLLPGADTKTAKIVFLLLIIISIEILTEECRGAMSVVFGTSPDLKKGGRGKTTKKKRLSGPLLGGKKYRTNKK